MTLYVPMLIAVETDNQEEAHECAATVAANTVGESFRLIATDPDMPAYRADASRCADMLIDDGYAPVL